MSRRVSNWKIPLACVLVLNSFGLVACGVNVEAPCSERLTIDFGEIRVAGDYEFRAATLGRSTAVCKMGLRPGGPEPTCVGFYRFDTDLQWVLEDSNQVLTITVFRDGVLVGERSFVPRLARGTASGSNCPYGWFFFETGEPVAP